jgi:hypothetical protein
MSALGITGQMAGVLGARMIFQGRFEHLWEVPDYKIGLEYKRVDWNYEEHGRDAGKYAEWVNKAYAEDSFLDAYNNKIMQPNICGMDGKIIESGRCLTAALPTYGKCAEQIHDNTLNMPVYYAVFNKPTKLMVKHLNEVRDRLSLPHLEPGLEPNAGAWGLYTPGYYLFALHFRMIPLGFEPLSVMLNEGDQLRRKLEDLKEFWKTAKRLAKQAKDLAACRNETLLIYFASDDAENLRPVATKKLSKYGRVVFGLEEEDVGHMSPQWTSKSEREVDDKKAEVLEKKRVAAEAARCEEAGGDAEACKAAAAAKAAGGVQHETSVVNPRRSQQAVERHNDMSLVEWWILANAQWLVTTRYSSYPATAGAWGLGIGGRMERMEVHGRPVFRIDWTRDDCAPARSADPAQAAQCPNL